jgi:hypothetical protein
MLATFLPCRGLRRIAAGVLLAAAASAVSMAGTEAAESGTLRLRCTNPASGANWPVVIDLDHARVDSLPATITEKWISWPDPKQGFFDLERATGKLQFRNASSTGGYFLNYTCRAE